MTEQNQDLQGAQDIIDVLKGRLDAKETEIIQLQARLVAAGRRIAELEEASKAEKDDTEE